MKLYQIALWIFCVLVISVISWYCWPSPPLPEGTVADQLVVYKNQRKLELWSSGQLMKTYTISLGKHPEGHKQHEGDSRTPEGLYTINDKNPNSGFHLNLGISYPNANDRQRSDNPGGDIKIHGLKNGLGLIGRFHQLRDWTNGCMAVTNTEMDELYRAVPIGTPIRINP